jgi:hypothetical protein
MGWGGFPSGWWDPVRSLLSVVPPPWAPATSSSIGCSSSTPTGSSNGGPIWRPAAVAEFLRERVQWIELEAASADPSAPPLLRALALLVQPEQQIVATLISRFNGRSIAQLSAMAGITVDEFTQSVAYLEIFGQGRQEGELTLRQLSRRCGPFSAEQESRIRALTLERLEALAEALLDFHGAGDLVARLEAD